MHQIPPLTAVETPQHILWIVKCAQNMLFLVPGACMVNVS